MRYDFDFSTLFDVKWIVRDIVETIEKNCDKDDDGDYVVSIGNENGNYERLYIKPDEFEHMKEFTKDL